MVAAAGADGGQRRGALLPSLRPSPACLTPFQRNQLTTCAMIAILRMSGRSVVAPAAAAGGSATAAAAAAATTAALLWRAMEVASAIPRFFCATDVRDAPGNSEMGPNMPCSGKTRSSSLDFFFSSPILTVTRCHRLRATMLDSLSHNAARARDAGKRHCKFHCCTPSARAGRLRNEDLKIERGRDGACVGHLGRC